MVSVFPASHNINPCGYVFYHARLWHFPSISYMKRGSVDDERKEFKGLCSSADSPSLAYEETAGFGDWQ